MQCTDTIPLSLCGRAISQCARDLAFIVHDVVRHKRLDLKGVLRELIKEPLLLPSMPTYILNHKKLSQCEVVCKNLRSTWQGLKQGLSKDQYSARHVLAAAVVSVESLNAGTRAAIQCIGLNFKSIKQAIIQRSLLDFAIDGVKWATSSHALKKDALSPIVKAKVIQWWTEETRVSPNFKDVVHSLVARNTREKHAKHFLEESQVHFPYASNYFAAGTMYAFH